MFSLFGYMKVVAGPQGCINVLLRRLARSPSQWCFQATSDHHSCKQHTVPVGSPVWVGLQLVLWVGLQLVLCEVICITDFGCKEWIISWYPAHMQCTKSNWFVAVVIPSTNNCVCLVKSVCQLFTVKLEMLLKLPDCEIMPASSEQSYMLFHLPLLAFAVVKRRILLFFRTPCQAWKL